MVKSRLLGAVGIVAVFGGIAGVLSAQTQVGPHSFSGYWTADVAASRLNGSVALRSASLDLVVSEETVVITNHTVDTSGRDVGTGTSTFRTDGQPHVHDELMPGLSVIARWPSDRLLDTVLTRPNGITDHVTYEVSSDGATLVTRTAGPFGTQEIVFRRP
jgi:hypothetical protein